MVTDGAAAGADAIKDGQLPSTFNHHGQGSTSASLSTSPLCLDLVVKMVVLGFGLE
jgi:hypothetical protein